MQQFRDSKLLVVNYANVTVFAHSVKDVNDQMYSNYYCKRDLLTISDDVRPRKLRYNINKQKWKK